MLLNDDFIFGKQTNNCFYKTGLRNKAQQLLALATLVWRFLTWGVDGHVGVWEHYL